MKKRPLLLLFAISCFAAVSWPQSSPPPRVDAPRIVRRASFVGITDVIPTKTLFTPKTDGLFRVSAYTELITPETDGDVQCLYGTINWSDDSPVRETEPLVVSEASDGEPYACMYTAEIGQNVVGQTIIILRAKAGIPVTIQTSLEFGPAPGFTYSLYITVEEID